MSFQFEIMQKEKKITRIYMLAVAFDKLQISKLEICEDDFYLIMILATCTFE